MDYFSTNGKLRQISLYEIQRLRRPVQPGNCFKYLPGRAPSREHDIVSLLMEQTVCYVIHTCLKPNLAKPNQFLWKNQLALVVQWETSINFFFHQRDHFLYNTNRARVQE